MQQQLGDRSQVKYLGRGETDKDAASVRANHPVLPSLGMFYFEVTIKNKV